MGPQPVPAPALVLARAGSLLVLARVGPPLVLVRAGSPPVAGAQLRPPWYQWVARKCSTQQARSRQVARAVQPAWRFPHGRS
jgi:hypothetical protein